MLIPIEDRPVIPLFVQRSPFERPAPVEYRHEGMTIAEIVASVPNLPAGFAERGIVWVNDQRVPREMWHRVRPRMNPKCPVNVVLQMELGRGRGGGGAKSIIAIVAMIAVLAAAAFVSGGGLAPLFLSQGMFMFGAGSAAAKVAAAVITVGGMLAISAVTAPPSVDPVSSPRLFNDPVAGAASGSVNLAQRGVPVPRAIGRRKVFPVGMCEPLIENVGDDQYVEVLLALAGLHNISDVRINETPAVEIEGVTYEVRRGAASDKPLTLVKRYAKTVRTGLDLSQHKLAIGADGAEIGDLLATKNDPSASYPAWHQLRTARGQDEFWISLLFAEGLWNQEFPVTHREDGSEIPGAGQAYVVVPVRVRLRRAGQTAWVNCPELHFARRSAAPFRNTIKIIWGTAPATLPTPATAIGPVYAYRVVPGQTAPPSRTASSWVAHPHFDDGTGSNLYSRESMATRVRNVGLFTDRAEIYLDPETFPKDQYEVEIIRGAAYRLGTWEELTYRFSTINQVRDLFRHYTSGANVLVANTQRNLFHKIVVEHTSSVFNANPSPTKNFALIAIKAKNMQVGSVSCIASGLVRDWNGSAWASALKPTSNPAPHFVNLLTGPLNDDPLPLDLLDNTALVAWRADCNARGLKCDAIIQGLSLRDALMLVAATGFARPRLSELWGVSRDYDRTAETPTQLFTARNAHNFHWEQGFARLPDGFRILYANKEKNYDDDYVMVWRNPAKRSGRIEEIRFDAMVDQNDVESRATFDLRQLEERGNLYSFEADCENIVSTVGDLIGIQYDLIETQADSARIIALTRNSAGNVASITLDSEMSLPGTTFGTGTFGDGIFPAATLYGVKIRKTNGQELVTRVTAASTPNRKLILSPAASPTGISVGCLVAFGRWERVQQRMIIADIIPQKDLRAEVVCVDEAPALF